MIVLVLAAAFLFDWFFAAWMTMLAVGAAHGSWWAAIPTMGFGAALAIQLFVHIWILGMLIAGGALKEFDA